MADFEKSVLKIFDVEGGWSDHPDDSGGATMFGITLSTYSSFIGRKATKAELKAISLDTAKAIYKKNYWDRMRGDELHSQLMAEILVDQAVNRGVSAASKDAQEVLNKYFKAKLQTNGKLDDEAVAALNVVDPEDFLTEFLIESELEYNGIIKRNTKNLSFINGWTNRRAELWRALTKGFDQSKPKENAVPEVTEKEQSLFQMLWDMVAKILSLFGSAPKKDEEALVELSSVPKLGDKSKDVGLLQQAIKSKGFEIKIDGDFGPNTRDVLAAFQKSVGLTGTGIIPSKDGGETFKKLGLKLEKNDESKPLPPSDGLSKNPAYNEAKKHTGKKESDSVFNKWLSGFWKIVGLPGYKTIIGTSFAWCGLFIAAMNSEAGLNWIKNGAGARNWAKYGVEIEWKKDGIPRGAVIHINNKGNCSSGSSNHVTFADGDCTPEYLNKAGSTVPGFGGNQSNTVKRSAYAVSKICAVRWPAEIEKPKRITKNVNCDKETDKGESTR